MDKWDKVVDTIVKTIDARIKKPSSAYSTEAQVKRIEGQTAYVDIPGGEPNMPARLTIDAKVGDTVQVSVDDHKATLTGNRTAPPTDDTTANEAKDTAEKNKRKVIKLEEQTGLIRQGVEGAQNMARQAEEDAENALTAANGKNKVYYLATQPTGGTYQIGDTWFDTANDNKIYHWNGTAWTASLLGDDALDTFSANHINAGTIDASDVTISNLNAGNITSGYLNAARIQAGSLSISKTSGLQSAIDDAAETATDYLQATSTGLKVGKDVGTTSNYALVDSSGLHVYTGNSLSSEFTSSAAWIGANATYRIGIAGGDMALYYNSTLYGTIRWAGYKHIGLYSGDGEFILTPTSTSTNNVFTAPNVHELMTAQVSEVVSLSTQNTYYKLKMAQNKKVGDNLSISSDGIKCAKTGFVLVSGQAQFQSMTDHHVCNIQMRVYDPSTGTTTNVAQSTSRSAGNMAEITVTPRLVEITHANSTVYMYVANTSGTGGTVGGTAGDDPTAADKLKNYLTVQYV